MFFHYDAVNEREQALFGIRRLSLGKTSLRKPATTAPAGLILGHEVTGEIPATDIHFGPQGSRVYSGYTSSQRIGRIHQPFRGAQAVVWRSHSSPVSSELPADILRSFLVIECFVRATGGEKKVYDQRTINFFLAEVYVNE